MTPSPLSRRDTPPPLRQGDGNPYARGFPGARITPFLLLFRTVLLNKMLQMAVGQNQWYHFGVGAPPIIVYFSGDWDVHWGYGILTHGQIPTKRGSTLWRSSKVFPYQAEP